MKSKDGGGLVIAIVVGVIVTVCVCIVLLAVLTLLGPQIGYILTGGGGS